MTAARLRRSSRTMIAWIAGSIGVFALLIIACGISLYRFHSENALTTAIAEVIPFPAAQFNSNIILYRDYIRNFDSLRRFYLSQFQQGNFEQPAVKDIQQQALERLIFDRYISDLARHYHISLGDDDVRSAVDQLVAHQHGKAALNDYLQLQYGWSLREYTASFLIPALRYRKVQDYVVAHDQANALAQQQAQSALKKLHDGAAFGDVEKEFGSETGMEKRGEIFTLPQGSLPQEIESDINTMADGSITDVISLDHSLQILKIIGHDQDTKMVRVQRIFIPLVSVEDMIGTQRSAATVRSFVF